MTVRPRVHHPRQRLRPDARIALILDAALQEFSVRGYEATRVDDIARRAGLSKGGLYAHFESKDDVFGALLDRVLVDPVLDLQAMLEHTQSASGWLPELVDGLYAAMQDARTMATLRLVLVEGHRVPDKVAAWRRDALDALLDRIGTLLRHAVGQGKCKDSVAARHPWLILAPLGYATLRQLSATAPAVGESLEALQDARKVHIDMLRELLEPPPVSSADGAGATAARRARGSKRR